MSAGRTASTWLELHAAFRAGEGDAVAEVSAWYRGATPETFALHDAQLVIARAYGFASWSKLKAHVDGVTLHRAADAVRAGDVAQVAAMLARNAKMVRVLMQYGADARKGIYPHRDATSALTIASDRGYDEIAIIHEEEANRRAALGQSSANDTPSADAVCEAIAKGQRAAAMAMLEADPSLVNAHHRDGWTPLHAAAAVLDRSLVSWLLDRNADVNARGAEGRTPLDVAAELLHTPDLSGPRWTAKLIDYVVRRRFRGIAADLRRRGAELSPASAVALGDADWLRARHAQRPLAEAIRCSVVEPSTGLLTLAVKHDRLDILKLLLALGLDPNERTRHEEVEDPVYSAGMPLHHCATVGRLEMAKVLLEAGADPNVQVYAAGSAMHRAYSSGSAPMIELLMRHGGVPDAVTVSSLGQVDAARRMLDDEAAQLEVSDAHGTVNTEEATRAFASQFVASVCATAYRTLTASTSNTSVEPAGIGP